VSLETAAPSALEKEDPLRDRSIRVLASILIASGALRAAALDISINGHQVRRIAPAELAAV